MNSAGLSLYFYFKAKKSTAAQKVGIYMFKRKQNKEAEISFFNNLETTYNAAPEFVYQKIAQRCHQLLKMKSAAILEIGCGSGKFGQELAKLGHKVIAIDLSDKMVNNAKKNQLAGYRVQQGDVENGALFLPNSFSLILCPGILHHIPNLEVSTAVENFYKWLKPEGYVVCWEPNGSNPVIKLSKLLFKLYSFFTNKSRYATINEVNHTYRKYRKVFFRHNLKLIAQDSFSDGLKTLPINSFFGFLVNLRTLMIESINLILPFPYSGVMLFLIFLKKQR